jgi:cytochrome P450
MTASHDVARRSVDGDLASLVQIEDPDFYDDPHPLLARMRAECPVFHYEPLDCFVLTKYDDVRFVGRTPEVFSSAQGFLLNDIRYDNSTKNKFTQPGAEFLPTSDPPRHRELRRIVAPSLTPRSVRDLEEPIRANCRELIDRIEPGVPIDFVNEVSAPLPLKTIARFFGVPASCADAMRFWADEFLKAGAALSAEELEQAAANARQMTGFFDEWLVRKAGSGDRDLLCTMLQIKERGDLTYENLHMFLSALMTGGVETTRDFLATSLVAFAEHPDQLEVLRENLDALSESATEECLRWVTPVTGFVRTVTRDTEIRGVAMRTGQHVYMLWTAANRDEEVWERAGEFDVSRPLDPMHVAFGFGEHSCIGASLARLQGRVFLEEIVKAYRSWEVAGEPVRPRSVMHNSYEVLPLVFHR